MMRAYICGIALLFVGFLFTNTILADLDPQVPDKWEALDRSLKNANPPYKTLHPKNGFVPDESTAVKIGEAIAIAQYGEKQISQERPFEARLRGTIWTIAGTLHPQGAAGGTAVIQLSKTDGRIVLLIHQE